MVEATLLVLVRAAVDKLTSQILEEFGLFRGLHKDIENLRSTLSTILAVLEGAEDQQLNEKEVKNWLEKLKYAAYEADDILDQCITEALRRQLEIKGPVAKVCNFFSASNSVVFDLGMAHKIKVIRERLHDIAEERSKFHLRQGGCTSEIIVREETDSFVIESDVCGREDDKERVVELLLNGGNEEEVSVISIIGMGGLGKTTLAQLVYNDARVEGYFDLRMWVCVSNDFHVKTLTRKIIESADKSQSNVTNMDSLQLRLREMLSGRKYLLVLDDVWNENVDNWERLKSYLRAGERGSKILVTARNDKVDSIMGTLPPYHLKRLSEDDCWSLFKQRAFGRGQEENPNLVVLGKEIVKKCGGVPLAAKSLGSLMRFKREEREWQFVKESEIWSLPEEENGILPALKLSYLHLPSQLKACFAYCSIFPKDHRIYIEELIHLWIGEGFIRPSQGNQPMEDIGREFFNNLLWRSFFQEVEEDPYEDEAYCKMHDLMHDLAKSVSGDSFSVVSESFGSTIKEDEKISFANGCRRLFCQFDSFRVSTVLQESSKLKKLRTLVFHQTVLHWRPEYHTIQFPLCLRVLVLKNISIAKDTLNSIGQLKQLRYLHLCRLDGVRSLPISFTKLQNLQILKLWGCGPLKDLPRGIRKLTSLRHLEIRPWGTEMYWKSLARMLANIGDLRFLRTLSYFIVGKGSGCNIRQLRDLNLGGELNLRQLENVRGLGNAREAMLIEKANLTTLRLSWSNAIDADLRDCCEHTLEGLQPHPNLKWLELLNYAGERLPPWMSHSFLPNLVRLSLVNCRGCDELPPLGQFGLLKSLHVGGMNAVKCIRSHFYGEHAFPSLEELTLVDMPNLEEWSGSNCAQALPRLKRLTVMTCPKLTAIPCFASTSPLDVSFCDMPNLEVRPLIFQNQTHLSRLTIYGCLKLSSPSVELGKPAALEELHITDCNELLFFPEELQNLTALRLVEIRQCHGLISLKLEGLISLTRVVISGCRKLSNFDGGVHHLTALEDLNIQDCPELDSLPEGMEHLTSLKSLQIRDCGKLTCLPEGLKHVPLLQTLEIRGLRSLTAPPEWIGNLTSLTSLSIGHCIKLTRLPEGLKHATVLQSLWISCLPKLAALPEWIGSLSSLQDLHIWDCHNLLSLPSGFQQLANLQYLSIMNCPQLEKRCKKETGEYWHMIAHIPDIQIGRTSKSRCFRKLIPASWIHRNAASQ